MRSESFEHSSKGSDVMTIHVGCGSNLSAEDVICGQWSPGVAACFCYHNFLKKQCLDMDTRFCGSLRLFQGRDDSDFSGD